MKSILKNAQEDLVPKIKNSDLEHKVLYCPVCLDFKTLNMLPLTDTAWKSFIDHIQICVAIEQKRK
jgi:hypothetical protein